MNDTPKKPRMIITRRTVEELFAENIPLEFINRDTARFMDITVDIDHSNGAALPEGAGLICSPYTGGEHPESEIGACTKCLTPVYYRKTAVKGLTLVCVRCARRAGTF